MHSTIEALESRIAPASIALGTGTTNSGNVTLDAPDTLSATLNAVAGSGQLIVTGTVTINGAALDLDVAQVPGDLDEFVLIENDDIDAISGTFASLPEGQVFKADGTYFKISYEGGDGNDVTLTALVPKVTLSGGGKVATFTDVDGDLVTVKTTRGEFIAEDFVLVPRGDFIGGAQLARLDLGTDFANANITFTAKRDLFGGNGFVNVGAIDATGVNLGTVSVKGDLGAIDAGGIKSLTVQSIGRLGTSTQEAGGSVALTVSGRIGTLAVKSDSVGAALTASGFGAIRIGGSIIGGSITSGSDIGTLAIAHDLAGTAGAPVEIAAFGSVTAPAKGVDYAIKTLTVGGHVEWTNIVLGVSAAGDNADASIGTVRVGGDWIASNLRAATLPGTDGFIGTSDDVLAARPGLTGRDNSALTAQIGSLTIKGQVLGSVADTGDQFGITAEQIKKAVIGGMKLALATGPRSPDDFYFLAATGPGATGLQSDVRLLEVLA